jgi:hypothetical protein
MLPSCYPGLSVCIVSCIQKFKVIVHASHRHQTTQAVRIFHRIIPSLVLRTMGVMHRVRRAFEAFDNPDQYLAQFVELRICPECDQVLVP